MAEQNISRCKGLWLTNYFRALITSKHVLDFLGDLMKRFIATRSFYSQVLAITIPIALQNLIVFGISMMDTIMLGRLGEVQISASAQANQPQFIFQAFIFGLAGGGCVLASQYWGKGDLEKVRRVIGIVVSTAVAVSVLLTIAVQIFPGQILSFYLNDAETIEEAIKYIKISSISYIFFGTSMAFTNIMRSVEIVKVPVITSLASFFVNVFFNWVLIFGNLGFEAMGIRGAALATLIARVCDCTMILVYVFCIDKRVGFKIKNIINTDIKLFRSFIRYAMPVVTNEITWALAISLQAAILGKLSNEVVAANSIASVCQQLTTIVIFGAANAACVVVGKKIGEGDMDGAKKYAFTLIIWSLALGAISFVAILLLRDPFISIYKLTEYTAVLTKQILTIIAVVTFFVSVASVSIVGVLRGAGDTKFCMFLELSVLWLIAIPLGLISGFVLKLPIVVVFAILKIDEPIKAVISFIRSAGGKAFKDVTISTTNTD